MTGIIVLLVLIAFFVAAGIVSALDMRPDRRPPEWSVGRLIEPHR